MRSLETKIKLVLTERCPAQRSAHHCDVLDSAWFSSLLSRAVLSSTQRCPGRHLAQLSAVLDKAQHN